MLGPVALFGSGFSFLPSARSQGISVVSRKGFFFKPQTQEWTARRGLHPSQLLG